MRATPALLVSLVLATASTMGSAPASPVAATAYPAIAIESYDVTSTPVSGFGCWSHTYSGTITDTGRTSGGSVGCGGEGTGRIADYAGGSGTLNDGVISDSIADNQLFLVTPDDAGVPIEPVITLHLAQQAFVQGITFKGGDITWNAAPGALSAVTVESEGRSYTAPTTPVGAPNAIGVPADDFLDLEYTEVSWFPTTTLALRDFRADIFGYPWIQFSLTEITVSGEPATEVRIEVKADQNTKAGDPVIKPSRGKVPVVIYGSASFPVADIVADGGALFFGVYGWEVSFAGCGKPEDTDRDGFPDLTCQFTNNTIDWSQGITTVHLNGHTTAGDRFFGTDTIAVRP